MRAFAPLLTVALAGCSASPSPPTTPASEPASRLGWPAPEHWRTETIAFPLEFAPDLPWRGFEELRFSPGMFDPAAPGYWSYAFIWWIEDKPGMPLAEVEDGLRRYFAGLCAAVGGEKHRFDASRYRVALSPVAGGGGETRFGGTADLYDAFKTGQPITLRVSGRVVPCRAAGATAVVISASPSSEAGDVWKTLREAQAAFQCPDAPL